MVSSFSMTIKIFLGIKSALYILFAWWGFQVCSPFFLKSNIQQKDFKIDIPFSNLLSPTVFLQSSVGFITLQA